MEISHEDAIRVGENDGINMGESRYEKRIPYFS